MISVSVVNPLMAEHGWTFEADEGVVEDLVHQARYLHQIYTAADPEYTRRVTVPVLWDKQQNQFVSNESSEIIRMLKSAFDGIGAKPGDYYPQALRTEVDSLNAWIYDRVNNGVYRAASEGDGVSISDEELLQVSAQEDSEIVLVDVG